MKVTADGLESPVAKFLTDDEAHRGEPTARSGSR
jgi:hypothetical protein